MAPSAGRAKAGGGAWDLVAADDPTDWKDNYAFLRGLDASLRCDLCFDIYTAPVAIKECAHTFCSACIRNTINRPGEEMGNRCPKCMNKNVYDSSLMPQPTLESVAQHWRQARGSLMDVQRRTEELNRKLEEQAQSASTSATAAASDAKEQRSIRRSKRNASTMLSPDPESAEEGEFSGRRRSARNANTRNKRGNYADPMVLDDSSDDDRTIRKPLVDDSDDQDWSESEEVAQESTRKEQRRGDKLNGHGPETPTKDSAAKDYRQMGETDLVNCPMCNHTFTMRALNIHLDKGTCSADDPEPSAKERGLASPSVSKFTVGSRKGWLKSAPGSSARSSSSGSSGSIAPKKLFRPNYDILKGSELKRILDECGLSTSGDRKRMTERHRKWVNLVNANLDASEKMRKKEAGLRRELNEWETGQYETAQSAVSEKKAKTWTTEHRTDFAKLAKQARETHMRDREKHVGDALKGMDDDADKAANANQNDISSSPSGEATPGAASEPIVESSDEADAGDALQFPVKLVDDDDDDDVREETKRNSAVDGSNDDDDGVNLKRPRKAHQSMLAADDAADGDSEASLWHCPVDHSPQSNTVANTG